MFSLYSRQDRKATASETGFNDPSSLVRSPASSWEKDLAPQPQEKIGKVEKPRVGSTSKLGFRAETQFKEGEWKRWERASSKAQILNKAHKGQAQPIHSTLLDSKLTLAEFQSP